MLVPKQTTRMKRMQSRLTQNRSETYICDRMELDVDHLVGKCHETEKHNVHADRQYSKTCVVSDQWLVLAKAVLLDQPSVDNVNEIPIETCVDETNENFGNTIPVFVDLDISLTWRLSHVSRNPLRVC